MRAAILGAFLLSAIVIGPVALAAPGNAGEADASATAPSLVATACEALVTPQGTSLRSLPREVSARRSTGKAATGPAAGALPEAPQILSDSDPLDEEPEAALRPAFYLCATDAPAAQKVLHRT